MCLAFVFSEVIMGEDISVMEDKIESVTDNAFKQFRDIARETHTPVLCQVVFRFPPAPINRLHKPLGPFFWVCRQLIL